MLFSERYGFKPVKDIIQVESMDGDLRNSLWNVLHLYCFAVLRDGKKPDRVERLCSRLWMHFFKQPIDQMPRSAVTLYGELRQRYFNFTWNEVYDFLGFVVENHSRSGQDTFIQACNNMLQRELSGWRFIGKYIGPMTNEVEIAEVEEALDQTTPLAGANAHLSRAV